MKRFILPAIALGTQHIIKADAEKEIISLSLVSGWGFIFFGPGGHAKSILLKAVSQTIKGAAINTKTCHSGLQVDEMKGSINLDALEGLDGQGRRICYNYKYSPLNADILFLEEAFDMPNTTGAGFKDWITEKAFRDGNEFFPLPLSLVSCVTNKEPADVAAAGDWMAALMERFPLQHRCAWDSYSSSAYIDLFNAPQQVDASIEWSEIKAMQAKAKACVVSSSIKAILAEMLAKAGEKGTAISPRTAMLAMSIVRAAAVIDGCSSVEKQHIAAIKYLPGLGELGKTIDAEIASANDRALAEAAFASIKHRAEALMLEASYGSTPIGIIQATKRLALVMDELASMKLTDTLTDSRKKLREAIDASISHNRGKALDLVKI